MLPVAQAAEPVFRELIWQAAQASVLYVDATTMRVREMRSKGGSGIDPKRTGTFTIAVVGEWGRQTIILYFTDWKHAGENLTEVLRHREAGLEPPILMCNACETSLGNSGPCSLQRNLSKFRDLKSHLISGFTPPLF